MSDILTPDEVDAIDMAAHNGEHTDGDLAALIASHHAQAARIEELEGVLRRALSHALDELKKELLK